MDNKEKDSSSESAPGVQQSQAMQPSAEELNKRIPLVYHKECYLPKMYIYPEFEAFQFDPRDIIICGFPKTGTTWTVEIVRHLLEEGELEDKDSDRRTDQCPWLEVPHSGLHKIQARQPPRFMRTHLPYQCMPDSFYKVKPKAVYVMRNPKDTIVSAFHYYKMFSLNGVSFERSFTELFQEFCQGIVDYGPYWTHVRNFWENRKKGHVHCLYYEDLKRDFAGQVREIATYLDIPLSDTKLEKMEVACSLEAMRVYKATNMKDVADFDFSRSQFYRKGK